MPVRRPAPRNQFSFSKVKAFRQCPLRYRYRYVEGRQEAFSSIEAFVGTVVHEVLEWSYRERDERGTVTPEDALERFARDWDRLWTGPIAVVRASEPIADYIRRGREMVARFVENVLPRDASTTVGLERRLSARLADDVVFTGIADRIGRTESGRLFVVDYKTSSSGGSYGEPENGLQARLYAACLLREHPEESDALAGYHYLATGESRWDTVTRDAKPKIWEHFVGLAREAASAQDYPPRPGVLCAWCGFNGICPAARVPDHLSGGLRIALAHQS